MCMYTWYMSGIVCLEKIYLSRMNYIIAWHVSSTISCLSRMNNQLRSLDVLDISQSTWCLIIRLCWWYFDLLDGEILERASRAL